MVRAIMIIYNNDDVVDNDDDNDNDNNGNYNDNDNDKKVMITTIVLDNYDNNWNN